jgi:hypothetical protein
MPGVGRDGISIPQTPHAQYGGPMTASPKRWIRRDEYGNRQPAPGWVFGLTVALLAIASIALTAAAIAHR